METVLNIIYNNKNEKIIKFYSESEERYKKRIELIKIFEKEKIPWKDAHKYSKIWYNIFFNKAKYNQELYLKVMKYSKQLK